MEQKRTLDNILYSRVSIDRALKLISTRSKSNLLLTQDNTRKSYIRKTSRKILNKIPRLKIFNKSKENQGSRLQIIGSKEKIESYIHLSKKRITTPEILNIHDQNQYRPCTSPFLNRKPKREIIKIELPRELEDSPNDTESIIMESKLKNVNF
jgi:hypothetical protein